MYAYEFPVWDARHRAHEHDLPVFDRRPSRLWATVRMVVRSLRGRARRS